MILCTLPVLVVLHYSNVAVLWLTLVVTNQSSVVGSPKSLGVFVNQRGRAPVIITLGGYLQAFRYARLFAVFGESGVLHG